jgi:hypothetical protein
MLSIDIIGLCLSFRKSVASPVVGGGNVSGGGGAASSSTVAGGSVTTNLCRGLNAVGLVTTLDCSVIVKGRSGAGKPLL